MTEKEITEATEWVFTTCRLFGAGLDTSHLVAGEFARGLLRSWGYASNTRGLR